MIIDLDKHIEVVGYRYGLSSFEAYYLLDSILHMGYDIGVLGACGVLGRGLKVGGSLVNFIGYVDSGIFSLGRYRGLLRNAYGIFCSSRSRRGSVVCTCKIERSRLVRRGGIYIKGSYLRVYRHLRRRGLIGCIDCVYGSMGYYAVDRTDRRRGYVKGLLVGKR